MALMPRVRRVIARRPWIHWAVVGALAVGVTASVADAMAAVDAERAAWGRSVTVWVATHEVVAGQPIVADSREVPAAVRPPGAVDDPGGAIARQAVGRGEIVTDLDLVDDGPGLAPAGWLVAPVRESLASGAAIGERVSVVSDGFVLADEAVVVGSVGDATLVAAPPDVAPLLPAADVTLLRTP